MQGAFQMTLKVCLIFKIFQHCTQISVNIVIYMKIPGLFQTIFLLRQQQLIAFKLPLPLTHRVNFIESNSLSLHKQQMRTPEPAENQPTLDPAACKFIQPIGKQCTHTVWLLIGRAQAEEK